ncbi:unnamed protein product [Coregonus sp. 'balchen']|nr:unnamed protein product [Coregonus sp. 'balchen']
MEDANKRFQHCRSIAGCHSGLVEVLQPCQLSTADWPVLFRDPSQKGSPTSLENGVGGMLLDDLVQILRAHTLNRPRHVQKRTGTPFGTPGAPGVNVLAPVEEGPRTHFDAASAQITTRSSTLRDMGSCEEEGLFSRSLTVFQNFLELDPQRENCSLK